MSSRVDSMRQRVSGKNWYGMSDGAGRCGHGDLGR